MQKRLRYVKPSETKNKYISMKNIAIIGECMIELNGQLFGKMQQTYGGDTLNTATYLSRITDPNIARVHYLTAVGDDVLSRATVEKWQADGIDTSQVLVDDKRQLGLYLIQLDTFGERSFLYWRNDSAARYLLQHPRWQEIDFKQFDAIYLSGISLAILPPNDRLCLIQQLIGYAASGGMVVFDSNYRPALWCNQQESQDCYHALLSCVQIALVTFDDERALWGDESLEATILRLQSAGVSEIVIKLGADGASYINTNERIDIPAKSVTNVVDTTSAGDAFNAGFLNGYFQALSPEKSCQQGNRLAGIVIQYKGAIIPRSYCYL